MQRCLGQVQRFLSQPFFVAEIFTGTPGAFVDLETTHLSEISLGKITGKIYDYYDDDGFIYLFFKRN